MPRRVRQSPDPLAVLLERAAEGDDVAMGDLVRRTQSDVWRVCTALGSRGEEADLVQETYLRAMRSLRSYRGEAPVRAWLLAIARHTCADGVRRRQRRRRMEEQVLRRAEVDHRSASGEPAVVAGTTQELLDLLDADRREAFELTQVAGLGYEEAAAVIGCPVGTVRSRVHRARADLVELVRRAEAV